MAFLTNKKFDRAKKSGRLNIKVVSLAILALFLIGGTATASSIFFIGKQADGSVLVPSNQALRPAGNTVQIGQRPTDIAIRPDGKQIAVATTRLTFLLDTETGKVTSFDTDPKKPAGFDDAGRSVAGLAYSPDGKYLYYSKGENHTIAVASLQADGNAKIEANIDTGNNTWPSGLSVSPDGKTLYVALFGTNSVGIVDLSTRSVKSVRVGSSPFGAYVSPDGKAVYISNWGGSLPQKPGCLLINFIKTFIPFLPFPPCDPNVDPIFPVNVDPAIGSSSTGTVSVFNTTSGKVENEITVGLHPTAVTFSKDSTRLYVANSNDDTISAIDLTPANKYKEIERILVRPSENLPFGSMPNGLALDDENGLLYVANGGNNAIAVVELSDRAAPAGGDDKDRHKRNNYSKAADLLKEGFGGEDSDKEQNKDYKSKSRLSGFIPTEWFPIGVVLSPDKDKLFIANNKGIGSLNYPEGTVGKNVYSVTGSVTFVDSPEDDQLEQYTREVIRNSQYMSSLIESQKSPRKNVKPVPVPDRIGEPSVFKHVIYIIKENRTYDQVLGDFGKGNSDPKLVQFGEKVTPNHHALARRFGLLDNFYASTINSADGHQWTDEAVSNVFSERVFGNYPSNSVIVPNIPAYGVSSLNLPPNTLWNNALTHGKTFRNYGENSQNIVLKNGIPQIDLSLNPTYKWSDTYNDWLNSKTPNGKSQYSYFSEAISPQLAKYKDPNFPAFDMAISDQIRADEWIREFNNYVKNGNLPDFEVMVLTNDHTAGTNPENPTTSAMVADNDLAVGRVIDSLSHSPYWKDTIVFVVEDDAQDGVDHVDGHRTVGLVVSAYNKKGVIDSTLYNQTSMVRTIEQILGLPPMNQFDLTAPLMKDLFQNNPDLTPYKYLENQIPLNTLNPPVSNLTGAVRANAITSSNMDFSRPDVNEPAVLNQIIWQSTEGDKPYPVFEWQRRIWSSGTPQDDDDD